MDILFVNGSPRGRYSVTLQSCSYLEKCFPEHQFEHLNVGAGIGSFERDMSQAAAAFGRAELIIFAYPVYAFLVPSQLHRFIELMKESGMKLDGKYVTQLTTSDHFFDHTAHRFIEENCRDMGMKIIRGLSAGSEDLLREQGQKEAEDFLRYAVFCVKNGLSEPGEALPPQALPAYEASAEPVKKSDRFDILILADLREGNQSLRAMIKDFDAVSGYRTRFVNLADFPFKGGCLGCRNCAVSGRCVYGDGFERFWQDEVRAADALVFAFSLRDHSMGSRFKMYDDRSFCGGLRGFVSGKPTGYICLGDMSREENLRDVLQARCQVSQSFFAGIAADRESIGQVASRLSYALEHGCAPSRSFYAEGGRKLLRDAVWLRRGMMPEDYRYFKAGGLLDFPQRRRITRLKLLLLGALLRSPAIRRRLGARFNDALLAPYRRVIDRREVQT